MNTITSNQDSKYKDMFDYSSLKGKVFETDWDRFMAEKKIQLDSIFSTDFMNSLKSSTVTAVDPNLRKPIVADPIPGNQNFVGDMMSDSVDSQN